MKINDHSPCYRVIISAKSAFVNPFLLQRKQTLFDVIKRLQALFPDDIKD